MDNDGCSSPAQRLRARTGSSSSHFWNYFELEGTSWNWVEPNGTNWNWPVLDPFPVVPLNFSNPPLQDGLFFFSKFCLGNQRDRFGDWVQSFINLDFGTFLNWGELLGTGWNQMELIGTGRFWTHSRRFLSISPTPLCRVDFRIFLDRTGFNPYRYDRSMVGGCGVRRLGCPINMV